MSDDVDLPEHVQENRRYWNDYAPEWIERAERAWAADEPSWGVWSVPETTVGMLPLDMTGQRAVELGCGTGYVSAWMARRGAEVVGVDISPAQLATVCRLRAEHDLDVDFVEASAESVPWPDDSFDFAISEYGAAIWCDPEVWIPEAARLLRPGGRLVFLGNHPLAMVCMPLDGSSADTALHRPWFGMRRFDWRDVQVDPGGVEFNLTIADWFALFRRTGFRVDDHLELRAPAEATEQEFAVPATWAQQYPSEQVWKLTLSGAGTGTGTGTGPR